ncbi:hypothetical protein [Zunongwangia endophytica]|uniref:Uncharacterized protein n=1 Tax=Zunongwangia endophytica TaxID=1808945 RepID=A0ABV8H618_9FLAO|nr:hypothetical protein [Zunongwangia endophytica]MDN3596127.1 hypothetical protein [Zunongwangia endophytica]
MDLQTRKLNLISYLAQIQDENLLSEIENYILKNSSKDEQALHEPFSPEELLRRIGISEKDFENGRYKSQDKLKQLTENW